MDAEDEKSIRESIRIINAELGQLWRSVERLETHVEWIKGLLLKGAVPLLIGTFLAVLGVLLKLLLA